MSGCSGQQLKGYPCMLRVTQLLLVLPALLWVRLTQLWGLPDLGGLTQLMPQAGIFLFQSLLLCLQPAFHTCLEKR